MHIHLDAFFMVVVDMDVNLRPLYNASASSLLLSVHPMRERERERERRDSETGRVSRREGNNLAAYITRAMADDATSKHRITERESAKIGRRRQPSKL